MSGSRQESTMNHISMGAKQRTCRGTWKGRGKGHMRAPQGAHVGARRGLNRTQTGPTNALAGIRGNATLAIEARGLRSVRVLRADVSAT
eukprot:7254249-Alexandrium_andersonii.AAC.1